MTAVATEAPPGRFGRVRRALPLVLLGVVLVLVGLLTPAPGTQDPLDPRSAEPGGTLAMVMILERLGTDVDVLDRLPETDPDTILVLEDALGSSVTRDLEAFVRRGGTLVVADPSGRLSDDLVPSGTAAFGGLTGTLERGCILPALSDADEIRVASAPLFDTSDAEPGQVSCFQRDDAAWMVIQPQGDGNKVKLGGASFLTNELIGDRDNAVLAASLLAPRRGGTVGVIAPGSALANVDETKSLGDLIPRRLRLAFVQLLLAFGVVVIWRARRLGKPVDERPQVQLAGSELVVAVGNLLQRTGATDRAADLLRADVHRDLAERYGFAPDCDATLIADAVAARTSYRSDEVVALLDGVWPASEEELIELAQGLEALRRATLTPATATTGA